MMDDYEKEYLKLCYELDDYTKSGVKKHNRSMKALSKLYNKLSKNEEEAKKLLVKLMKSNDERVQVMAASHCLGMNVNTATAEKVLENITINSMEPLRSVNAKMTLNVWKGQGFLDF